MQGINLHAIVRSGITTINPDELVTLYQSAGQVNIDGLVSAKYAEGAETWAQWQPNDENTLEHTEKINKTKDSEQVFLYSDTINPIAGIRRKLKPRTGDMIKRGEEWYLVTSILEDWSPVGWINIEVTMQTKAPDFSASDWHIGGGSIGN